MTIEQKFLEAFNIEQTYVLKHSYYTKDEGSNYEKVNMGFIYGKDNVENYLKEFGRDRVIFNRVKYPPITPEIVMGLEEIILKQYIIEKELISNGDNYDFEISLRFYDEVDSYKYNTTQEKHSDCILECCINIKDEIQDQITKLFK